VREVERADVGCAAVSVADGFFADAGASTFVRRRQGLQGYRDRQGRVLLPCAAALSLEPGIIIGGSYRVEQQLGRGAMGEVWSGVRIADGLRVALKVLQTAAAARGEVVARFKREAQVLGRVRSDFVASVIDFSSDPDYGLLLILQLIPGESLLAVLSREKRIPLELALHVGLDIARGLHDLHEARIVHRDLKPGNVVLQPLGAGRYRAVLIDFGISRIVAAPEEEGEEVTAITRAGTVLGTLEYIAPEQIFGSQTVTGTADLYALGAIIYRAVAGQHAFLANADAALLVLKMTGDAPELPVEGSGALQQRAKALVARLMARDPGQRYQTAQQAAAEIQSILALVEDDTEFTTGIRAPAQTNPQQEFGYGEVATTSSLADAVDEDGEDETAAQISVDWEAEIPVAVDIDEHTSDDEIQTIFRPGQLMFPRPGEQPLQPYPGHQVQQPFPGHQAQQRFVQYPGVQPTVPGAGTWQVETLPPGQVSNLQYPLAPQQQFRQQSAVETMNISACRPGRPRWSLFVFVVAMAALVGGVAAYLLLARLLYPAH
jgi:serine/threonine protein kinase